MDLTRNRSRSFVAACLMGAAALGAGCSSTTETVSSGAATATTGTGPITPVTASSSLPGTTYELPQSQVAIPGAIPETTIADPSTTLEPTGPIEPPTIPANGGDPQLLDCGIVYRASGWPTTMAPSTEPFVCLQHSFDTGTPARLVDREQTDGEGGAILVTTYDVLGTGRVRVTVDAREAADRPQGVTTSECTGLATEAITVITSGCTVISS